MIEEECILKNVIIVGAGFGGLGMAVALRMAGKDDFLILEKCHDVGGVWRDNTYPGCTCDVPSHLYSFSFAPYECREKRNPSQQDILEYLQNVAAKYKLEGNIELGAEVSEAHFHQKASKWDIYTSSKHYRADIVIFATGQLHQPNYPRMLGLEDFQGQSMHSAAWDHRIRLRGKRISVIGTGSSAVQMLPELAEYASELTIYQRTPQWVLPKPDSNFNFVERFLLGVPGAHRCYRGLLSQGADLLLSPIPRCRTWRYVVESYAKRNLNRQVPNKILARKLTPSYPIGSKRIILDNNFYTTLQRDNVKLVTATISSIGRKTINVKRREGDQVLNEKETDVIIFATGFKASNFLLPISVRGRDGHVLEEDWNARAEAFLGLAIWGYPNLFMIAGPNSFNPAGSNPGAKELQIAYIMRCLQLKEESHARAIEVKQEAILKHQEWLTSRIDRTIWPKSIDSWYKDTSGQLTCPWPASRRSFKRKLRSGPKDSFVLAR